ncbi:hypothetical protein [Ornithinibacillus contaminans]|uniref:hypothetical protein n=1 Tax=Ornithinibacillus contaminans TaxID=694055 RepID=UPI00064E04F2|nr:hypothetical protein [Ornithinibacillus contaminans]
MKRKILFILIGISVMVIGLFSYNGVNSNVNAKEHKVEEDVIEIGATFMADFDNKQILAGTVDYIFTGKVTQKLGEIDNLAYPTTQFKVEANNQLQGKLPSKEVTINQYGGHLKEEVDGETIETLYLFEGDPLLETGNEYVFAANKQEDGSILIIPLYGNTKIEKNSISTSEILDEFEEAVKNPIIPELQQKVNESKK